MNRSVPSAARPAVIGVAMLVAVSASAVAACPLTAADGELIGGDGVTAAWRVIDGPLPVAQPFAIEVRACPQDAELTRVDATMPAHRHGMNYAPSIVATGPGRWRVDGLLWHMPGAWELVLSLQRNAVTQRLGQAVTLQ